MDNARATAVLEAVEEFFKNEELHHRPAVMSDGPQFIGGKLGYPPAEVMVLLRQLHRKGRIGLIGDLGPHVIIARDQSQLKLPTAIVTSGGKKAKLSRGPRGRSSEVATEDEHSEEVAELLAYIAQLETMLDDTQARLDTSERKRLNITDARNRSDEAKAGAEKELQRVKAENTTLKREADKVPELERQLAEQQGQRIIPTDLAAAIAKLTQ